MARIVQKYGGTSVGDVDRIKNVAARIKAVREAGNELVVVVSASATASSRPVVVIDPGHDLRANPATEPIGPGASTRKIKDGGGTRGVVSGTSEADLRR